MTNPIDVLASLNEAKDFDDDYAGLDQEDLDYLIELVQKDITEVD